MQPGENSLYESACRNDDKTTETDGEITWLYDCHSSSTQNPTTTSYIGKRWRRAWPFRQFAHGSRRLSHKKITQRPSTHRTTNPNTKQSGPKILRFERHIPRVKTPPIQSLATVPESHRWEAHTPLFPEWFTRLSSQFLTNGAHHTRNDTERCNRQVLLKTYYRRLWRILQVWLVPISLSSIEKKNLLGLVGNPKVNRPTSYRRPSRRVRGNVSFR